MKQEEGRSRDNVAYQQTGPQCYMQTRIVVEVQITTAFDTFLYHRPMASLTDGMQLCYVDLRLASELTPHKSWIPPRLVTR